MCSAYKYQMIIEARSCGDDIDNIQKSSRSLRMFEGCFKKKQLSYQVIKSKRGGKQLENIIMHGRCEVCPSKMP